MFSQKSKRETVRCGLLRNKSAPAALSAVDFVCSAGAQCPEVQSSTVASAALSLLAVAATTAHTSLDNKLALAQALMVAIKTLHSDLALVAVSLASYQAAVNCIAMGDGAVINSAGLETRELSPAPAALEKVSTVSSAQGDSAAWALLSWPAAPGASGYMIEVNFTPENPAGPWTALTPGTRRRRAVKGPAPRAQFLARIASVGSNGEQAEWSDPILVTAR